MTFTRYMAARQLLAEQHLGVHMRQAQAAEESQWESSMAALRQQQRLAGSD